MSILALKSLPRKISVRNRLVKQVLCLLGTRRLNHSTTTTIHRSNIPEPTEKEDFIRKIFDDSSVWRIQTEATKSGPNAVGLFENPKFADIHGINYAAQQAIQRAQIIVERICNAPENGPEEMSRIVKNLDRLSDTLCSVIDMAEFIRNAHPDQVIMEAANKAYGDLCSYMNTLNTDTRIHQVSNYQ